MSRAFTKESDQSDDLPERPVSSLPNYVTPGGLAELKEWKDELIKRHDELRGKKENEAALLSVLRDLRYVEARIGSSVLIDNAKNPPPDVRFGATVELENQRWTIVGEDEADAANHKLSWASPIAMALIGAKPGDTVTLPDGTKATLKSLKY